MQREPMTKAGYEKLSAELKGLKSKDRPETIQAISEARAQGDLSENAEYHAAKEKQGFIEGRIQELEAALSVADVIDIVSLPKDKIAFGATVKLLNDETGKEVVYQIVGRMEADLENRKISTDSPISRAMIGKAVGDTVVVRAPKGDIEYEITDIGYKE